MGASDTRPLPPTRSPRLATTRALRALQPRERWTPSQWAENCRVLSDEESSEPGPYSFDRTPYWRFVLDAAADPLVEEIVCLKGAQIGWSESVPQLFGYWVDLDPGPTMILMPDQKSAEDFKAERIDPLMKNTRPSPAPDSRAWDDTKHRIRFDTMSVFFVWAGSKTGTKSRPIRYLICEEPDEYPPFSSTGGDPLSKAEKRLTTYRDKGRAKILLGGTPTTRTGNVWKRWEMCAVRYHYWVPCPHCNGYQLLQWKQVKWPAADRARTARKHAERVKSVGLAYYECEHCKGRIDDHHKPRMLRRGCGRPRTRSSRRTAAWSGPERGQARRLQDQRACTPRGCCSGNWRGVDRGAGRPERAVRLRQPAPRRAVRGAAGQDRADFIAEKAKGARPPMVVPKWARAADRDGRHAGQRRAGRLLLVRRSARGATTTAANWSTSASAPARRARRSGASAADPDRGGGQVTPQMLLVDSGGPRWSEVYQLAQSDPRIHPTKGAAHKRTWMVDERPQKHGVVLWEIDTEQSKDLLHRLIHDPDRTKWLPHNEVNDDYCRQMCSESKVFNPTERSARSGSRS
jgi:hypothetical protein